MSSSTISDLAFNCNMCKLAYSNVKSYYRHFLSRRHQGYATLRAKTWDKSMKDRAVVATVLAVGDHNPDSLEFIELFSSDERLITDFILSYKSQHLALIQFKNREDVIDILASPVHNVRWLHTVGGCNQLFVREASCVDPGEWEEFCSPREVERSPSSLEGATAQMTLYETDQTPPLSIKESKKPKEKRVEEDLQVEIKKKRKFKNQRKERKDSAELEATTQQLPSPSNLANCDNEGIPSVQQQQSLSSSTSPHEAELSNETNCENVEEQPCSPVLPQINEIENRQNINPNLAIDKEELIKEDEVMIIPTLWESFKLLLEEVKQPHEDYITRLKVLEDILAHLSSSHPIAQVFLFRHNYLRLKNGGSNDMLIYFSPNKSQSVLWTAHQLEKALSTSTSSIRPLKNINAVEDGVPFIHQPTGTRFGLSAHPLTIPEVISCQLLGSLLNFDPRGKHLLALIHFWARLNGITLAEENIPRIAQHIKIPEPAALEWLCLFFLASRKHIPPPREVLHRGFKPGAAMSADKRKTFVEDVELTARWRRRFTIPEEKTDEFVVSLLQLANGFFKFLSKIENGSILNTIDCEILTKSALLANIKGETKLKKEEGDLLRKAIRQSKDDNQIFLMQPLAPSYCFSISTEKFNNVVAPAAKLSARKIRQFLNRVNNIMEMGLGWPAKLDLKDVFDNREFPIISIE